MEEAKRVTRRRHSKELRTQVLAECTQPGISVAQVAMAHGLNANLVHKWRRTASSVALIGPPAPVSSLQNPAGGFVALTLPEPGACGGASPSNDIRIELRRGTVAMSIHWPRHNGGDAAVAAWLRDWLR